MQCSTAKAIPRSSFTPAGASFDRLAPFYLLMERLLAGRKLQRCRTAYLPQPGSQSVLVLGPGRGQFLPHFLQTNQRARVTCLDSSARMLNHTETQIAQPGLDSTRVRFVHADVFDDALWEAEERFDLVVSHFFLDCFQPRQLDSVVSRVASVTSSDAIWLLADFCLPDAGLWRWRAKLVLSVAYAFFRVTTRLPARRLTPPDPYLLKHGFRLDHRQFYDRGLLHSDLWRRRP